ncbi:rhodanese-like domain-containing protein [Vaginella massiliensis]|uniref:MBL fold metallo-hydrolase n=1 Tax=Vaginella massiliensis TaxID=1816680 RepID=UPI00375302F4
MNFFSIKNILLTICLFLFLIKLQAQTYFFQRVFDETLSQASYIIGDFQSREAIVIDPKRDIDTYLEIAKENKLKITKITETHIHADFLSGSRELQAATNANLYLSDEGGPNWQYQFPHIGLKNGNKITFGQVEIEVMHTPGHTPESLTFIVKDTKFVNVPHKAITGDFVFVGDVGRPDLLEKTAGELGSQMKGAKQLFASLVKFSKLPDNLEIWPGHGEGSFCGKSLSNIPFSILKEEKQSNKAFQFLHNEEDFIRYILEDQPTPPQYFAQMKQLNKAPRPLLIQIPKHTLLQAEDLQQVVDHNLLVIDTRKKNEIAKGFIKNSLHIENSKMLSTWVGSLVDYQQQLVLISDENQMQDITRKLTRIGMDNIYGFVTDIEKFPSPKQTYQLVEIEDLKKLLGKKNVQLIDVRTEKEYKAGHIKGIENIVLTSLENNLDKISKDKEVVIHCQSGVRAAMAYSILRKNGLDNVKVFLGGINEWVEKQNQLVKE